MVKHVLSHATIAQTNISPITNFKLDNSQLKVLGNISAIFLLNASFGMISPGQDNVGDRCTIV